MLQYLHVYYMCALLKGLHPRIVTEGFELAKDKALEVRFFFSEILHKLQNGLLCNNVPCNKLFTCSPSK